MLKIVLSTAYKFLPYTHCKNILEHSALLLALGIGWYRLVEEKFWTKSGLSGHCELLASLPYKCTSMGVQFCNWDSNQLENIQVAHLKQVVRGSIKLIGFPKHRAGLLKKKKSIYGIAKGYPKINVNRNFFHKIWNWRRGELCLVSMQQMLPKEVPLPHILNKWVRFL